MKFGTAPGSSKKISRIVFGGDRAFGHDLQTLDRAFERGINAFDTARMYTGSEEILGRWLKSKPRDQIFVVSKGGYPGRFRHRVRHKEIFRDVDASLKALGTDHIDAYFFHYDATSVPAHAIAAIATALHSSGKVCIVGFSNFAVQRVQAIHALLGQSATGQGLAVSAQLSLPVPNEALWPWPGSRSISGPEHESSRQSYRFLELPLFAYSCLARGFFSNANSTDGIRDAWLKKKFESATNVERHRRAKVLGQSKGASAPQIALAYVFHKGLNLFATIGWSDDEQCKKNIAALDIELDAQEVEWLEVE